MAFTVRAAVVRDAPSMHRVRTMVKENRLSDPRRVSEASYLPFIAAASIWVAEKDTRVVGFAAVDKAAGSVWALFVDPRVQGAGIGSALLQRMLLWAGEQRLARLTLSTGKGTKAVEFYMRAGWREIGATADGEVLLEITIL